MVRQPKALLGIRRTCDTISIKSVTFVVGQFVTPFALIGFSKSVRQESLQFDHAENGVHHPDKDSLFMTYEKNQSPYLKLKLFNSLILASVSCDEFTVMNNRRRGN